MGGVKGDNSSVMGNQVGETMHGKGGRGGTGGGVVVFECALQYSGRKPVIGKKKNIL